ncbi:hypothetical protein ACFWF7_11145 [Nocardia sp. NPDC060256]|uniref:hypothetical protein n=1 Tax=unclassified Nocardia TaxID=2637762 RepID=UPI003664B2C2
MTTLDGRTVTLAPGEMGGFVVHMSLSVPVQGIANHRGPGTTGTPAPGSALAGFSGYYRVRPASTGLFPRATGHYRVAEELAQVTGRPWPWPAGLDPFLLMAHSSPRDEVCLVVDEVAQPVTDQALGSWLRGLPELSTTTRRLEDPVVVLTCSEGRVRQQLADLTGRLVWFPHGLMSVGAGHAATGVRVGLHCTPSGRGGRFGSVYPQGLAGDRVRWAYRSRFPTDPTSWLVERSAPPGTVLPAGLRPYLFGGQRTRGLCYFDRRDYRSRFAALNARLSYSHVAWTPNHAYQPHTNPLTTTARPWHSRELGQLPFDLHDTAIVVGYFADGGFAVYDARRDLTYWETPSAFGRRLRKDLTVSGGRTPSRVLLLTDFDAVPALACQQIAHGLGGRTLITANTPATMFLDEKDLRGAAPAARVALLPATNTVGPPVWTITTSAGTSTTRSGHPSHRAAQAWPADIHAAAAYSANPGATDAVGQTQQGISDSTAPRQQTPGTGIGSSTRIAVSEQRPPSEHESDWETVSDEDSIHSHRTTGYDQTRDDASDSEDSAYRARRAAWVRGKRRVGDPAGPPDEHDIADESARTTQEEPQREIPTIEITPPDGMSDPIRDFGTRRDGSQDLNHITPVPQETVEWLHEQVFRTVEGNRGADEGFRAEVRRVLSGRLLSSEWARLLSESGMPLRVQYRGRSYPVSLRVSLRAIGPAKEQIEPLQDGPPVGIQRWAFWISDTGDNAGSSDLRAFSYAHAIRWGTGNEKLSSVTLTPEVDIVHNQLSTGVSVGATVQPMTIIRSKGRSWPFDYEMVWELRENDGPRDLLSPKPPAGQWRATTGDAPNKLLVWFPGYVSKSGETPRIDPEDPATIPAPMDRLRADVPLHGVTTFPDHDKLLADVMASFDEHFDDISDNSAEQLREFFSEGNVRSMIPMSWDRPADSGTDGDSDSDAEADDSGWQVKDGSVESPIFYTASGKPIGFLEITTDLHGGTEPTGPTTEKSVLESYVLRSLRAQGSSTIANSLGGATSLSLGFGGTHTDPATGTPSRGGQFTVQGKVSQHFSHTLNYGGSARMAHSLRTGEPLLHVTPTMTVRVRLVRPDGPPIEPKTDSPLDGGRDYPINMLVPSLATLGHAPTETRYAPPEILHLKQLGVSTTPLRVDGVEPLLVEAGQWLSEHGFFPSGRASSSRLDAATLEATHTQRLNNLRKFNQLSNALGRRSALDEMIEGGTAVWFELPTRPGTERVSINLAAERRYPTPGAPLDGVEHQWTLPKVQTLNYTGSTIAGDEQFTKTPRAWHVATNGSITNPLDNTKHLWFQNLTPDHTFSSQSSKTQESTAGTGHEYYTLSPTDDGTQVFTVPVTYRMQISHSHIDRHGHRHSRGAGPAPSSADGTVRLAVPTYRTTTEKPEITAEPADPIVRDRTDQDTRNLALPSPGRTLEKGVLRIPETALLDRVGGSKVLRKTVLDLIDGIELEAAENARTAPALPGSYPAEATEGEPAAHDSAADPETEPADDAAGAMSESGVDTRPRRRVPGEFPDDPEEFALPRWNTDPAFQRQRNTDEFADGPEEYELPLWNTETDPAIRFLRDLEGGTLPPPGEFPHDAEHQESHPDPADARADTNNTEPQTHTDSMRSALGELTREMVRDGTHWAVDKATGMGRWVWRTAVGEPATNPESMAHELTHTALSPQHVNANALRTFRDSYVIEGANTPGALAGTDITVEMTGYLTDVKVLSQPPKMDGERWLQSVNGSAHTESAQRGHRTGATYTGSEGDYHSSVVGGGAYHYNTTSTKSSTTNDNSGVFRVTTEDTTPVHRFSATAHYVVTVRVGNRNFARGVLPGGMRGERTRTIEIPDAVEFLLVDNDLQNHPDLLALVSAHSLITGTDYEVPEANEPDRRLPTAFVESGKLGFGTVTDVHLEGGRNDLQDLARELIEEHAPRATTPGTVNYQPGVLTRINEHTTTLGLRTLPNAGDEGAVFHFIDRSSWLGPRLVEVKFSARPDPAGKWSEARGKRVTATSGLDNIFGHSTGHGAALGGATRVATTQTRGHQVDGILGGQINGHRPKFDLAVQRTSSVNEFQQSSREIRSWQSTLGNTSEFPVPYRYVVEVKSRRLDEALLTYLVHRGIDGLAATGQALGVLPPLDVSHVTTPPLSVGRTTRAAQVLIRFNTSETPPDDSVLAHTNPAIYRFDPATPGEDDAISYDIRSRLGGPPWLPSRPIEIYDFGGVGQLAQALRLVDPSLDTSGQALANRSSEGMFIRLTTLVESGRLTVHGPAASAPFLTAAAPQGGPDPAPHTGKDHDTTTSIKFTLYSPRIEKTSKDTAIHRVEWSGDGFGSQVDNTLSTAAAFGMNVRYTGEGGQRGTFNTPITGEHADHGQSGTVTSNRRELLRFGTPMETANGGTTGHRIRALGVLEIRGPKGTLWVIGDLLLRSTETPPPEAISFPPLQASADSTTRPGTGGANFRTRSSEPQQNTNEPEPTDLPPNS